jgi:hypothetical protein
MVAFGVFIPSPLSSLAATASSLRCGEAVIEVGRAEDVDTASGKSPCNPGLAVADLLA